MAEYDAYPDPSAGGFLLDVQSDLLSDLNTRTVVPLRQSSRAPKPATRLNPTLDVNGDAVVMVSHFLAAVPVGILKFSAGQLDEEFDTVEIANDMPIHAF